MVNGLRAHSAAIGFLASLALLLLFGLLAAPAILIVLAAIPFVASLLTLLAPRLLRWTTWRALERAMRSTPDVR